MSRKSPAEPDELTRIRRYELKYLVTPAQVDAIRDYLQAFCVLDRHASPELRGYTVNNLYLDTPDLRFYQDVKLKKLRRFKPRVRYYGERPDGRLVLEIKNKEGNIVWKNRRHEPVSCWPDLVNEAPIEPGVTVHQGPPADFVSLVRLYGAAPVLHVRYFREPWVSVIDDYGRVTFDRSLRCRLARGSWELAVPDTEMVYFDNPSTCDSAGSLLVLEVKVERRVPRWALAMIRRFELWQRGYSKYCYTIDRFRELSGTLGRQPARRHDAGLFR